MADSAPLFAVSGLGSDIGLTARDVLRMVFKHGAILITCAIVVTVLTWSALLVQPPIYESTAKIWVQTEQQGTPSFLSGITAYRESQDPEPVDRKIETEIQLLMSRANAEAVVTQLGIRKAQLVQSPLDNVMAALPHWPGKVSPQTGTQIRNATVALFSKAVAVEPLRSKTADTTSNVFEARFDCVDKTLAPHALDALLQAYIRFGAQHNRELGESAYQLVDAKTREVTAELKQLDDQMLALTVAHASDPNVSLPAVGADGAALAAARTGAPSALGLLKTEIIEAQAKLAEARQLFTEDAPNVRHLAEQLKELRSRLDAGVRADAELNDKLEVLLRQRALAQERFTELRTKRDQIELYLKLNPAISNSRVVIESPLQPDRPKTGLKVVVALLGPLAGLFFGLLLAGLREYLDHRLTDPADVRRYLGLVTLVVVPKERV